MKIQLVSVLLMLLAPAVLHAADRPNIVLIISDDQAWTDYGFMGHHAIQTPNLDKLATQGAVFRRGYVSTALCRPSLMSLITGLYAHQHLTTCLLYTSPSPRDRTRSRMPSSA